MFEDNLILKTDSYKLCHFNMYPEGTENVYSYLESRKGAQYPFTVFFGLQYLLQRYMSGKVIFQDDINEAELVVEKHLGNKNLFNRKGWEHIIDNHNGYLPLKIKAVPEGSVIPTNNILMSVEATCSRCYWLVNYMETLLTHVWYSSTVATTSKFVKNNMERLLGETGDPAAINFMLHDFGYRGATSDEAAAIGGAAHLVNFMGTDTIAAMGLACDYYGADLNTLAFSVPATEHSIMTSLGRDGEYVVLNSLMDNYPSGILSVVADSFDIYKFVDEVIRRKGDILSRDGRFVVRPDSITSSHPSPSELSLWIIDELFNGIGGSKNSKGFRVLDDHVRVLWGDGIDPYGIIGILELLKSEGYAADNMIFGMGGGLLQKVNRDTQRFAFKSSAQKRDGVWHDVKKEPLDTSKTSKAGRLTLIETNGEFKTINILDPKHDILETVYEDGDIIKTYTFDEIRERAANG